MRRPHSKEVGDREDAELAQLADGSLAPSRRPSLEARVDASAQLSDRLAEQRQAVAFAHSAVEGVEAPEALRTRIEAQRRARGRRAPRRLALAATAAGAVAAAAIGVAVLESGGSGARFRAVLAPTGAVPGAHGEATLTRRSSGWRVQLDASGLPQLSGGRFYEAWLRNGAGVLVPIGTFNEGHAVTLWAGVSPKTFTTVTVTRERADGNQSSSGEKVLVGTVTERR